MHHKATLTAPGKVTGKPYHIQCACGSAGDFQYETAARAWFTFHISRIGTTETSELNVPGAQQKPLPPPAPGSVPAKADSAKIAKAAPADPKQSK